MVEARNDLGRYRGHSPWEFMLGRTPEMDAASLMNDGENTPLIHKLTEADADEDPFMGHKDPNSRPPTLP